MPDPLEPLEAVRRDAERRKTLKEIAELKPCIWVDLSPEEVDLLDMALVIALDHIEHGYRDAIPPKIRDVPWKVEALRARLRVPRGDAE